MFKSFKDRIKDNELLSSGLIKFLILISIIAESFGLFSKTLGSNDAIFYSTIAKHIVISHDWINLYYAGNDWLDKPHIPFWLTALSFKIFGINPFAYILPGFLFHLLGGYYTYKLGSNLFSKQVGLLSTLFYFTSLHLMLSAIDIRAEAFLLGEITPAIYYLLLYNDQEGIRYRYLILSAVFSALAIMTKGVFALITIYSGLLVIWLYNRQYRNFISKKWLYVIGATLFLILPELICLFIQFDLHPDKLVFGRTNVSGLKFFFWDSQFGRFFEFGPYVNKTASVYAHYFYFMHTFMWAFLPWSIIFLVTLYYTFTQLRLNNDNLQVRQQKQNLIFLLASFFVTFILFSLTSFQLDHYTNIIIPFASILCANWLHNQATRLSKSWLFTFQIYLSLILISIVALFSVLILPRVNIFEMGVLCLLVAVLYIIFIKNRTLNKAIVYPCLAISLVFIFTQMVNSMVYIKYDAGYQIAKFLNAQPKYQIIDYNFNSSSLDFYSKSQYLRVSNPEDLKKITGEYFLVAPKDQVPAYLNNKIIKNFDSIDQNKFIPLSINQKKLDANTKQVSLLFIGNESASNDGLVVPMKKYK